MLHQRDEIKGIVEEYVDLKCLNIKPLLETLEFLFSKCGEKSGSPTAAPRGHQR